MEPHEPSGPVFVALPAEIDRTNAERLGGELRAAIRPGVTLVIADGSLTKFCDSSGMQQLLAAQKHAAANHAELRLVCASDRVARVVRLLGIEDVLRIYPDLGAAVTCSPQLS
jgi:anti-sigma B factor antagonist